MLRTLSLLFCFLSATAMAETLTGLQIIERAKQNGQGLEDMTHQVKMILVDESGDESEREMLMKAMTDKNGKSYSMSIFTAPKREKGISLLTESKKSGEGKQYLYLPSTRRVKRITSSNRSSSFRGSEFTFEDLSDQKTEDYDFKLVKEAPCGELSCYVVDRFPRKPDESSYSKTQLWIDTAHFRPMKADFFDKENALLKTMETSNYQLVEEKYWNPEMVVMSNHQTGKSTKMVSVKLTMNNGLKASEFSELAMRSFR